MTEQETIQSIWESHGRGIHFPAEWTGKLGLDEAYRVQLGILALNVEHGSRHAGWKVGLTADAIREMFGAGAPVFGYLLMENSLDSGHEFTFSDLQSPAVESEVLVTLGRDLTGPGVTAEDARGAVAAIAPAFEIVERRGGDLGTDFTLGIADNVMQRCFVHGSEQPLPPDLDLGDVQVDVSINGQVKASALGKQVMDNPLQSLAWLANSLTTFGQGLKAGQRVMTGSFTKPIPAERGDAFESRFTHLGNVNITFG